MSIRTAIEINHDYHAQQTHKRDRMVELLFNALYFPRDAKSWEALKEFGIHRVYQRHHSDDPVEAHTQQASVNHQQKGPTNGSESA